MISQKIKASARMLGFGLLAVAISAPAALAQAKKTQCPFTSKDIDGWYKDIGFDKGADDAGRAEFVTCADEVDFVTLSEIERRLGQKTVDGETVTAQSTFKHILVDVRENYGEPNYTIELIRDGSPIIDPIKVDNYISLSSDEYLACRSAVLNSQAWKRWSCGKQ